MQISERFEYPAAPDEVFDMMTDEEFQALKCEATYAVDYHVDVTISGDTAEVITERHLPTHAFPDFVRSMVGSTILVVEKLLWQPPAGDGSRQARITINTGNAPIALLGLVRMGPAGPARRWRSTARSRRGSRCSAVGSRRPRRPPSSAPCVRNGRPDAAGWNAEPPGHPMWG